MASFDVVVLGGGTGGYVAALRGAQLGLRVALVEKDKVGGTCLHRGCIPTKTYLRSAELLHALKQGADFGLRHEGVTLDFSAVFARKERVVKTLYRGVQGLLKKSGVTVFHGTGTLVPPSIFSPAGMVAVALADGREEMLEPEKVIIATGSRPRTLGLPIDGIHTLTSDEALALESLPRSIIIVGGGAVGVEWASLLQDFGVTVTLVESLPRILAAEDEEISAEVARQLGRRQVTILTGAAVLPETVRIEDGGVSIEVRLGEATEQLRAEALLVAAGREPVAQGLGLENRERVAFGPGGFIQVDGFGRTGDKAIYAIGDVAGGGLAHVAARQGIIAMEHIAGLSPLPFDRHPVPRCVYARPEVASVGCTEAEARSLGHEVKVGKFPFRALGKALVHGDAEGFAKIVTDARTGDLLGIHMVGPDVTNLISEAGLAMLLNGSAWELGQLIRPHPSLSEVLGEAALAVEGRALHF